ncbi:MAG TPA: alpha/beta hydrolase [Candidatus Limnocylindria bacterium]|nr:alpha/beta hydrolase [Candidatus Limnocylindria bacterium]
MPERSWVRRLCVWEWDGAPPGALLLHGIGNYGRYWDLLADAVAGRVRLVAPDARGHGESLKPAAGYAPTDFVDDATAVMDARGLARPLVVGHSMGGFHATALTLAHPDRVRGLVLVDVGPRVEEAGASRARRLSLGRPDRFADEAAALAYLRETSPGYGDAVYENRMRWLFARKGSSLVWRSSKDALAKILDDAKASAAAVWDRLGEIACPVLVVRGTRSPSFAESTARRMLATLKDARLVELDSGHNVALERPRELADAVVRFSRGIG